MRWLGAGLLFGLSLACSDGSGDDDGSAGSSGAGGSLSAGTGGSSNAGGSTGGSSAGGAGAGGASAGTAGSASGAGGQAARCSGTFGAPTEVLSVPGYALGSLSLGPGELELIYARGPIDQVPPNYAYFRSVRTSVEAAFPVGEPVPELDAACADPLLARSGDLSADGLRYYFVCYSLVADALTPVPLRVARRSSLDAPFVLDTQTYGAVSAGPSLGPDELELFTSPLEHQQSPLRYTRASLTAEFGSPASLGALGAFQTPELAADGLTLFGARNPTGTTGGSLWVATRPSPNAEFGVPVTLYTSPGGSDAVGSAAISGDCRSLYYVKVTDDLTTSPVTTTYRVEAMKR